MQEGGAVSRKGESADAEDYKIFTDFERYLKDGFGSPLDTVIYHKTRLIQTRLNASGIRANQVDEFLAFILTTFLTGLTEEDRSSCNLKNLPPAVRKGFVINASINFLN